MEIGTTNSLGSKDRLFDFLPIVFLAGLASAAIQNTLLGQAALGPGWEVVAVARNLEATGEFANPFSILQTGPTAIIPPLYPLLLALMIRTVGDGPLFGTAALAFTLMLHALQIALLPLVSKAVLGDVKPGLAGGLVTMLLPVYVVQPQYETMLLIVGLECLVWILYSTRPSHSFLFRIALPGLVAGLLLLVNPSSLLLTGPLAVFFLRRNRTSAQTLTHVIGVFLCAAVVCSPWLLRNYLAFGTFPTLRTNFGLEFHLSNNELAAPNWMDNWRSDAIHPNESLSEARKYRDVGEVAYSKARFRAARQWVAEHPSSFLILSLRRVKEFWLPSAAVAPLHAASVALVNLLSLGGALLMARQNHAARWLVLGLWIMYPTFYYLIKVDTRYVYPVLWLNSVVAGYLLVWLLSNLNRRFRFTA